MVEIPQSGSGGGPGWVTARGYPTLSSRPRLPSVTALDHAVISLTGIPSAAIVF